MKSKLRVALIGCGAISDNHLIAIKEYGDAELTALCDIREDRLLPKLRQCSLGEKQGYTDYIRMLDEVKPDAVHIATPHYLHCEMTLAALERGINVFLEKPMCISRDEIEKLIEAERKSSARVCVCFQNRYNLSTIKAKQIAEADGGAKSGYGYLFWHRDEGYYLKDSWRGKMATEGGGVLINQAIHTLDLLCFFLGKPSKVCATTLNRSLRGVIEVEDTAEGTITFDSGKRACFYATNAYTGRDSNSLFIETENHKIEFRNDGLYIDNVYYNCSEKDDRNVGKQCYGVGHTALIAKFYDALIDGSPMPISLLDAVDAVKIILAAYESSGEEISI